MEITTAARDLLGGCKESAPELLIELIEERSSARADALAAWDEILVARKKVERATDEGELIRIGLRASLESVGIGSELNESLDAMVAVAERFLDRQAKVDAERTEAVMSMSVESGV
ncbi:hypothetical protein PV773_18040 [Mesorhizobium sp. CC13]|uniref:hypothetical protein n=1 Tax=Mesorhizobium sp. CC13 TaxID=3029194 RepID=UPI0032637AB3